MPKGSLSPCLKRSNSTEADRTAGQVRMPPQAVARLAGRHGLGAGGAFGAARPQVQNGLTPMPHPLLHKFVHRINFYPLRAPAEDAVLGSRHCLKLKHLKLALMGAWPGGWLAVLPLTSPRPH